MERWHECEHVDEAAIAELEAVSGHVEVRLLQAKQGCLLTCSVVAMLGGAA